MDPSGFEPETSASLDAKIGCPFRVCKGDVLPLNYRPDEYECKLKQTKFITLLQ